MRKINLFYFVTAIVFGLALTISSCTKEGPTGPAGADGTAGENGLDGSDGTDGVDGNATCMECHTLGNKAAVEADYALSTHFNSNMMYTGQTIYQYAGEGPGRTSCTGCHSEQGFVAWQYTGNLTYPDTNGVQTAMPVGCVACHDMHSTFDFENDGVDYALRATDPVELEMYKAMDPPQSVTLDMGGSSNLCTNCHQPRRAGPDPEAGGEFTITSSHWGPHHGPQSTTLEGIGAFEIGAGYPAPGTSTHRTDASCTSCHMGEGTGHTWEVAINACTNCHESATDFDINGVQTQVQDLMAQLQQKFIDNGMWDEEADHILPGTYPNEWAGAYYNYAWVADDRSDGVHNPAYIKTMLINSIAQF